MVFEFFVGWLEVVVRQKNYYNGKSGNFGNSGNSIESIESIGGNSSHFNSENKKDNFIV